MGNIVDDLRRNLFQPKTKHIWDEDRNWQNTIADLIRSHRFFFQLTIALTLLLLTTINLFQSESHDLKTILHILSYPSLIAYYIYVVLAKRPLTLNIGLTFGLTILLIQLIFRYNYDLYMFKITRGFILMMFAFGRNCLAIVSVLVIHASLILACLKFVSSGFILIVCLIVIFLFPVNYVLVFYNFTAMDFYNIAIFAALAILVIAVVNFLLFLLVVYLDEQNEKKKQEEQIKAYLVTALMDEFKKRQYQQQQQQQPQEEEAKKAGKRRNNRKRN
jgi:hypothetical protein